MKANKQSLLIGLKSFIFILWGTILIACDATDEPEVIEDPEEVDIPMMLTPVPGILTP